MKHIIFVQNTDFPKQGTIDIYYYSKYLSKFADIKVTVIVAEKKQNIEGNNIHIIELGHKNYLYFIFKSFLLIKDIKKKETIDYVYFFALHPFSVILQFFVKYFLRIKTIYDVVSGPIGKGLIYMISKYTIKIGVKLSNKYVVLDKGLIQKIGISKNKAHTIIPMGHDEEVFYEKIEKNIFTNTENDIVFTYIGTLDKKRNLSIFIKAFVKNITYFENIKLYFIGFGNDEDTLKEISGKYLNTNIFFLGKKEHNDIPKYINSSDILVSYVPKVDYFEYQPPTKLIEYLACNKPVIATNTLAQQEILKNHKNLFHEDDIVSTQKQIQYCIENISILNKENYKKEVEKYSWEKLVFNLYNFICNHIGKRQK